MKGKYFKTHKGVNTEVATIYAGTDLVRENIFDPKENLIICVRDIQVKNRKIKGLIVFKEDDVNSLGMDNILQAMKKD